jgi:hypothetical protein
MDKLVEYRKESIWRGKSAPQRQSPYYALEIATKVILVLVRAADESNSSPEFLPLNCNGCHDIIRGSHFQRLSTENEYESNGSEVVICESCFRDLDSRQSELRKLHKHCVLSDCITTEEARRICSCPHIRRSDIQFPFPEATGGGPGARSYHKAWCPLRNLTRMHMNAKLQEVEASTVPMPKQPEAETRNAWFRTIDGLSESMSTGWKYVSDGMSKTVTPIGNKIYNFGNVHMALMLGPIVIENGVEK